ncbi:MAG: leucine-rich repeat domain-containing protein, partial [Akkermansia muciniphila]
MRLLLPLPLRRFLLGRLLFSVTLATAASGAEFVVDASQATNPGQHVYNTLQELAASGALSSGDTVILHNDDSSLTGGLTVAVNFRSNDPDTFRTIDLAGLGERECLYDFSGAGLNDITLEMNSIILSGSVKQLARSMTVSSLMIEGKVQFDRNCVENRRDNVDRIAIALLHSSHRGEILKLGDGVIFSNNCVLGVDNRKAQGGVLLNSSNSPITIGDHVIFSGNYAFSNLNQAEGGVIYSHDNTITIGDNSFFIGNYASSNSTTAIGGVITSNRAKSTVGANATFIGNYAFSNLDRAFGGVFYSVRHQIVGMGFHGAIAVGSNATFINNYAFSNSTIASGGVICSSGDISFSDGATFINNYAKTKGGAIMSAAKLDIIALTKDVLFSGNMTGGAFTRHDDGTFSVENGVANAIYLTTAGEIPGGTIGTLGRLALAAEEGREIRFNDPITSRNEHSDRPLTLTL